MYSQSTKDQYMHSQSTQDQYMYSKYTGYVLKEHTIHICTQSTHDQYMYLEYKRSIYVLTQDSLKNLASKYYELHEEMLSVSPLHSNVYPSRDMVG